MVNDITYYQLDPETDRYTFKGNWFGRAFWMAMMTIGVLKRIRWRKILKWRSLQVRAMQLLLPMRVLHRPITLSKNTNVGALLFIENFSRSVCFPGLTTTVNNQLSKFVSTTVSYTMSNRAYGNLGAGLSLNFAPIKYTLLATICSQTSVFTDGE